MIEQNNLIKAIEEDPITREIFEVIDDNADFQIFYASDLTEHADLTIKKCQKLGEGS